MQEAGAALRLLMCALLTTSTGCLAVAIVKTAKDPVSSTEVEARVTTHQADVSGELCYVEKRVRSVSTVHVPVDYRISAITEIVAGAITIGVGASSNYAGKSYCDACVYIGVPIAADGVLTALYIWLRDNEVSTSESWNQASETAPCRK